MKIKTQNPPRGSEHYEEQLRAINPNNQYNYQATKPGQIYRNYQKEIMNYPHMQAAARAGAIGNIDQYILANNQQNNLLNAQVAAEEGQKIPQYELERLNMLKQKGLAQQAINQGYQNQYSTLQNQAAQKAWEQQQAHNAWLTQQQQLAQQQIKKEPEQPQYIEQPLDNGPEWYVWGNSFDQSGQKVYNLKNNKGKPAGPLNEAAVLQYFPGVRWNNLR